MKIALALAVLFAAQEKPRKVRLAFEPKDGDRLRVEFAEADAWEYKEHDMKGVLRTELGMVWTFAGKDGKVEGTAAYDRVVYRGSGVKMGKKFDHDVEWTARDGYLKGKDSEAVSKFCSAEIKEGVALAINARAECAQGPC
jgi:hypothetical protein